MRSLLTQKMKQFKDPFEAAFEEQQEDSPPESPSPADDFSTQPSVPPTEAANPEDDELNAPPSSVLFPSPTAAAATKNKEEEDEDVEDNMEVELSKLPSGGDPDKMAKMQAILSQFTEEQMNRYESFRRSGFQKATMKRLLTSITGSQKVSMPMTIVMSGIAKMFVGELVETARIVMTERKESGPIRPCHIREAYRRLKLEGKVPKRTVPRLFR
ncbi:hypothetical protein SAY87_014325 [Trapa incisa]|uniref:TAFII28-like protein domain-containing protein n=2 Tax=Trapa TaxID=22665 RepID=A0AAN7REJ7_TRANT|nr:hypothetical protein SAY87_014325 [Trapa incisa]KAK4803089.1 hypothetical protein SAY86_001292 [Trapa natans]